jgi:ATP-dependent Lon protease
MLTGQLGDVMQESAQAGLSYARANAKQLGIQFKDFDKLDIHIHLPEGAIPKDGPSAGITMATALISALTRRPVRRDVAMTGEITLRGRVLPIGGFKEKVLAAHRAGIKSFYAPEKNRKDLVDVSRKVQRQLDIQFIERMDEVLDHVLMEPVKNAASNSNAAKKSRSRPPIPAAIARKKSSRRQSPTPPAP